jgi:putative MFS transporter
MNESPYWLTKVGKIEKAKQVIYKFASKEELISTLGTDLSDVVLTTERSKKVPFSVIWDRQFIMITVIVSIIAFTYAFGYWGIFSFIPGYLIGRGVPYHAALEIELIYALAGMPGYALSAFLMEKPTFGRKKVSVLFLAITATATVAFLNVSTVVEAIISLAILSFFSNGIWGTLDAWFPEQYPTEARNTGNGWAIAMERIAPVTAPLFVGAFVLLKGADIIISAVLLLMIVVAIVGTIFLRETRGVDLV